MFIGLLLTNACGQHRKLFKCSISRCPLQHADVFLIRSARRTEPALLSWNDHHRGTKSALGKLDTTKQAPETTTIAVLLHLFISPRIFSFALPPACLTEQVAKVARVLAFLLFFSISTKVFLRYIFIAAQRQKFHFPKKFKIRWDSNFLYYYLQRDWKVGENITYR